jgi:hypothetical protein
MATRAMTSPVAGLKTSDSAPVAPVAAPSMKCPILRKSVSG